MVVCGTRLFGYTDSVHGLFHVSTKFYHCEWCPLCPAKSYLIFHEQSGFFHGSPVAIEIPLQKKSVCLAWGRGFAIILAFIAGINVLASQDEEYTKFQDVSILIFFLISVVLARYLCSHKSFTYASYERATELCSLLDPTIGSALQRSVDNHFMSEASVPQHEPGDGHAEMPEVA